MRPVSSVLALALFMASLATVSFAAEGPLSEKDKPVRAQIDRGLTLQREGKYDEAIKALKTASTMSATEEELTAEALVELAETYFRKGKDTGEGDFGEDKDPAPILREAVKIFEDAVKRFPKVESQAPYAAYMIGSCHLLLGDMQKAFEAYRQSYFSYKSSKFGKKSLVRLGVSLAGLGMAKQATQIFQNYLQQHGSDEAQAATVRKIKQYISQLQLVGRPAPPIRAKRWINGAIETGLQELQGDVVVVVFFATWCKVCSRELPALKREIKRWKDKGIVFLGVVDPDDPKVKEPVEFYVKRNELELFDIALDNKGRSWYPYRVSGLPAAVVIDRKGIVRWRGHFTFMGHTILEKLLAEKE